MVHAKSVLYYNKEPDLEATVESVMQVTPGQLMEAAALITPPHCSILTFMRKIIDFFVKLLA